ncbi:MAG: hypothetical protein ACREJC_21460, partial [Tepidisphaeraceae bacterium]
FGLRESLDVKAVVEMLRKRPFVDGQKVAVVGVGAGANAALIDARDDSRLAALVLDEPITDAADMVDRRLVPAHRWLQWMRPLCKWTFEIAYQVDAEDLDLSRYDQTMKRMPVLMLGGDSSTRQLSSPRRVEQVCEFLKSRLADSKNSLAGAK